MAAQGEPRTKIVGNNLTPASPVAFPPPPPGDVGTIPNAEQQGLEEQKALPPSEPPPPEELEEEDEEHEEGSHRHAPAVSHRHKRSTKR